MPTDPQPRNSADTASASSTAEPVAKSSSTATREQLRDKLTDAARSSAIGKAADGELSGKQALETFGGWFGIVEAIVPSLTFVLLFRFVGELGVAVAVPAALGVLAIIVRLVMKQPVGGAVAGLFGMVVSGLIAVATGQGVDYFVLGLWINALWTVGLALSIAFGWPLIGVVVGLLWPELAHWRRSRRQRLWMHGLTIMWMGVFVIRLLVQVPLYQAGAVEALATARIVMGVPLYALAVILSVVLARLCARRAAKPSKTSSANINTR